MLLLLGPGLASLPSAEALITDEVCQDNQCDPKELIQCQQEPCPIETCPDDSECQPIGIDCDEGQSCDRAELIECQEEPCSPLECSNEADCPGQGECDGDESCQKGNPFGDCANQTELAESMAGESDDPCIIDLDACADMEQAGANNPRGCLPVQCEIDRDGNVAESCQTINEACYNVANFLQYRDENNNPHPLPVLCGEQTICPTGDDIPSCINKDTFCESLNAWLQTESECWEEPDPCPDFECTPECQDAATCIEDVCVAFTNALISNYEGEQEGFDARRVCSGDDPCSEPQDNGPCSEEPCAIVGLNIAFLGSPAFAELTTACETQACIEGQLSYEERSQCMDEVCAVPVVVPCVTYNVGGNSFTGILGAPVAWIEDEAQLDELPGLGAAIMSGKPHIRNALQIDDVLVQDTHKQVFKVETTPKSGKEDTRNAADTLSEIEFSGFDGFFLVTTTMPETNVGGTLNWLGLEPYTLNVASADASLLTLVTGDARIEINTVYTELATKVYGAGNDLAVTFGMARETVTFHQQGIHLPANNIVDIPGVPFSWSVNGKMERTHQLSYKGDFPWDATASSDVLKISYNEIDVEVGDPATELRVAAGLDIWDPREGQPQWEAFAEFHSHFAPSYLALGAFGQSIRINESSESMTLQLSAEIAENGAYVFSQAADSGGQSVVAGDQDPTSPRQETNSNGREGPLATISFSVDIKGASFTVEQLALMFELKAGILNATEPGVYIEANAINTDGRLAPFADIIPNELLKFARIEYSGAAIEIAHLTGIRLEVGARPMSGDFTGSTEYYIEGTAKYGKNGYLSVDYRGLSVSLHGDEMDEDETYPFELSTSVGVFTGEGGHGAKAGIYAGLNPVTVSVSAEVRDPITKKNETAEILSISGLKSIEIEAGIQPDAGKVLVNVAATMENGTISILPALAEGGLVSLNGIAKIESNLEVSTHALEFSSFISFEAGGGVTAVAPSGVFDASLLLDKDGQLCFDASMDVPLPQPIGPRRWALSDLSKLTILAETVDAASDMGICTDLQPAFEGAYQIGDYHLNIAFGAIVE